MLPQRKLNMSEDFIQQVPTDHISLETANKIFAKVISITLNSDFGLFVRIDGNGYVVLKSEDNSHIMIKRAKEILKESEKINDGQLIQIRSTQLAMNNTMH